MKRQFYSKPVTFPSLGKSLSHIRAMYKDTSGVYVLVTLKGLYVGSSVDLARRMSSYYDLTTGARKPSSKADRIIASLDPNKIGVIFLCFCPPVVTFVEEQLAMFLFRPTINTYLAAMPNIYYTHIAHAEGAIALAIVYRFCLALKSLNDSRRLLRPFKRH